MGRVVIVAYRPKPGKDAELLALVKDHLPTLRSEWLVTDRPGFALRAKDGTLVEVFEWVSEEAIAGAHTNPVVTALWAKFNDACDYVTLGSLPEAQDLFAEFEPVVL
ncbi:MAG: hypothetical protein U0746_15120 [Gemmataceae bacterium]